MSTSTTSTGAWKFSVNPSGRKNRREHPDYCLEQGTRSDGPAWKIKFRLREGEGHGKEHLLTFSFKPVSVERARSVRDYLLACVEKGLIGSRDGWNIAVKEARKAMREKGWVSYGPHNQITVH